MLKDFQDHQPLTNPTVSTKPHPKVPLLIFWSLKCPKELSGIVIFLSFVYFFPYKLSSHQGRHSQCWFRTGSTESLHWDTPELPFLILSLLQSLPRPLSSSSSISLPHIQQPLPKNTERPTGLRSSFQQQKPFKARQGHRAGLSHTKESLNEAETNEIYF